jgi:hypothetical protein
MSNTYRRIVLASRPTGWVVLVRNHYLALEHGSHGLTGGLNYYRASGLHPATKGDPAIGEGSHWVIHEQPARVNALIAEALDEAC